MSGWTPGRPSKQDVESAEGSVSQRQHLFTTKLIVLFPINKKKKTKQSVQHNSGRTFCCEMTDVRQWTNLDAVEGAPAGRALRPSSVRLNGRHLSIVL